MLKSIALILFSIALALGGQFLLKSGMNQVGQIGGGSIAYYKAMLFKTFINPYVIVGLLLYALSSVFWLIVLSRVDLSFAYPFLGIGYLIIMFISWRYLHEPMSALRIAGAVLIGLGVVLISRG